MTARDVLTVTELTRQIKDCLEGNFPAVAVLGEISNLTRAGSGHVYLTLKDENSQIRGVLWRSRAQRLRFELKDGLQVVAIGAVEVYGPRGTYQIVCDQMLPQGMGPLELAFRQLQEKLRAEGLFDAERKRPLPHYPRRIAVVTSPTGAAVRDIIQIITRRWSAVDVLVVPVPVQGDTAAPKIAAAIRALPEIGDIDVAIVGRGGGSLEDLWAFNEEVVARAIADSPIPIVSAVGHEIDVSIADFVADRRAHTPSEAAELVVPDRREFGMALDEVERRMVAHLRKRLAHAKQMFRAVSERRVLQQPLSRIHQLAEQLDDLESQLVRGMRNVHRDASSQLEMLSANLDALSPLKVLSRGYSITTDAKSGHVVRRADEVSEGDEIVTRLESGRVTSRVESVATEE
ncbi:exodeoxyribonuclease VII large subunit [Maioricimonas sp. JC845]|uniref:exodeoxyribonuclease VII large subunit n=1 Tax=Maioricimonas sp. JC845 TaxID=3232138 RepID=UPI00345981ED